MGRTPDAYDGPRIDEAVIWEEQASDPTEARKVQYVTGKGLVILEDGVVRGIGESRENTWQAPVDQRNVNTPPGSPATGYRVIIGSSPTGAFAGRPGEIAQWDGSAWVFTTPKQGTITTVQSENEPYKQTAASSPWNWEIVVSGGVVPDIVAFSGYDSSGGTNITSGWTDVPLDSERKKTSDFTHTSPSAEVTINRDDTYVVAATLHAEISSGTSRSEAEMRVMLDTGSGYALVPGTQLTIYNRTLAQGKGAVTKVFVIDLNDGDKLKIQGRRESGGSTIVLKEGSELVVSTTRGPQGPAGPSGDNTVDVEDEGSAVGTFDTLNFTGAGVTATDAGGGVTDIAIPGSVDEKVKVSANDTTADYLLAKLAAGSRIAITELNDGGNEDAQISVSDEYQYDEDATTRSTTSTGWDLAHRFTTSALAGGTYRVGFYYTWSFSRTSRNFKARLLVDGTEEHYHEQVPTDSGSDQRAVASGFVEVSLGAGAINIDLEFSRESGPSSTSYIYVSRLEIVRVS